MPLIGALALARLEALYRMNDDGRPLARNQWDGGEPPRLHLLRTPSGNAWRIRADVPAALASELARLCGTEPALADAGAGPAIAARCEALLAAASPVTSVWTGPAFGFPGLEDSNDPDVVAIDGHNADLLAACLPDWLPDVPHRRPFMAAICKNEGVRHAVAVCASVRMGPEVHEAGVETHPRYRRRGHALRAVRSWALAVRAAGATPVYSTSWDNEASLAVARRLGLELLGVDYQVT
jgi:GNAT superfamily N-acetyltransferase